MNNFSYARGMDVSNAVREISADSRAKFIAGGTNLIDLMKEDVARPSHSPNFVKIGLIVLLTMLAVILIAKFVIGLKLDFLGL